MDSESDSSAWSAGSGSVLSTSGSGSQGPKYASRRTRAEVWWVIASRVVTVARNAFGDSITVPSRKERVSRRNASWTMSSASLTLPVIR
jgi:hypothetical protein